jgi:hypothetical protein
LARKDEIMRLKNDAKGFWKDVLERVASKTRDFLDQVQVGYDSLQAQVAKRPAMSGSIVPLRARRRR